ncbi:regulator of microtubule dynamics protein 2 isoform X2 [Canis lupus familiaris]|uniref:Regulator of microtubule dynamics protein 2 n=1 Tax=Canis lupus familiaris TaxID=9615 RepID=A0A8C0Z666_CANLF|nr:regulator of microtubule dynamics protein 2 isoform X2 [Canis lupus familiaris]XP_038417217.1 regulator of microtubule dynamics protein 2 isoform X2 [Canis lupus familiaris]XP_038547192.1 regulator of microtubule dynamics protein 2 isoform X2 [Canis lupus familiaris]|eukprot:XP_022260352.1 regulator of microtubule dynamics protein 2 isoform X2 [Canis lupus familiaris]
MGKCLSHYKEDENYQLNYPADQVPSDSLHHGTSFTHRTLSLDPKRAHLSAIFNVSSRRESKNLCSPSNASFFGRRHSLFAKLQKSNIFPDHQQGRANFDFQEKRNSSDSKSSSNHRGLRSQRLFSAPKLSIISCYDIAGFFDLQSSGHNIFNPDEIVSKNPSISGAEKYLSSRSSGYNITHFMSLGAKANPSTFPNTIGGNTCQHSTATILSLPAIISYSCQQNETATNIEERGQLRYITANTDTEEQSFPVSKAFNTHIEELNLDVLLQKADNLRMNECGKMESFELLCDHKEKFRDEIEFTWRLTRAYGDMYELSTNAQEKKHFANIGKTLGERAITRAPTNGHCHLWYAVLCGYVSEFEGLQNKINYGHRFKEHLDKAIQFLPEEPFLYYLKGRYCYTVSKLSWIEKKMAATLFGKIPSSTVEEALQNFLKVEELHPGFSKSNYLYLAKCYIDLEQADNAVKFCNLAVLLPCVTKEDKDAQKEVKKISTSLKRMMCSDLKVKSHFFRMHSTSRQN